MFFCIWRIFPPQLTILGVFWQAVWSISYREGISELCATSGHLKKSFPRPNSPKLSAHLANSSFQVYDLELGELPQIL
jgi:hypothetical protein